MDFKELEDYILTKPGARLDFPFDEHTAVYKVADKMFALAPQNKTPIRVSLKCDPTLAEVLREKYVSVGPGYHLNKRHWNTIVVTGELENQEIFDLIDHSYQLVVESLTKSEQDKLNSKE
jgi:predicted DNA-binding protein (MmcQ/YjbR family)